MIELLRAIFFYRTSSYLEKISNGNVGLCEDRRLNCTAQLVPQQTELRNIATNNGRSDGKLLRDVFSTAARRTRQKAFRLMYREGIAHSDTSFFYERDELWSICPSQFRLPILWHRALFYDVAMKNCCSIIDKFWCFYRVTAFMVGMDLYLSSKHSFCHLIKFFFFFFSIKVFIKTNTTRISGFWNFCVNSLAIQYCYLKITSRLNSLIFAFYSIGQHVHYTFSLKLSKLRVIHEG